MQSRTGDNHERPVVEPQPDVGRAAAFVSSIHDVWTVSRIRCRVGSDRFHDARAADLDAALRLKMVGSEVGERACGSSLLRRRWPVRGSAARGRSARVSVRARGPKSSPEQTPRGQRLAAPRRSALVRSPSSPWRPGGKAASVRETATPSDLSPRLRPPAAPLGAGGPATARRRGDSIRASGAASCCDAEFAEKHRRDGADRDIA